MLPVARWTALGFALLAPALLAQSCSTDTPSQNAGDAGDAGSATEAPSTTSSEDATESSTGAEPSHTSSSTPATEVPSEPDAPSVSTPMLPTAPVDSVAPPAMTPPDPTTAPVPAMSSSASADGGTPSDAPMASEMMEEAPPPHDAGADGDDDVATEAAAPMYLDEFRLAVIGSSTAAGEGASDGDLGWVSLLDAALSERGGSAFELHNLAVSGYTSAELSPGSDSGGSIDDALDWGPNLVIVALAGSNDLSNGTSTETLFERLHAMRDAATEAGAATFFLTTAPKDLSDDERQQLRSWAGDISDQFGSCDVPGQSAKYSPCVVDVFAALANEDDGVASQYSAGDGIHLNDAGHERLFEAALPIIEPYVCAHLHCD